MKIYPWERFNLTTSIDKDGWNKIFYQINEGIYGGSFVNTCYDFQFGFIAKDVIAKVIVLELIQR